MRNKPFMHRTSQKFIFCLFMACAISSDLDNVGLAVPTTQTEQQSLSLKDRASALAEQIISAINEVEITGDFKSAAQKRKIDDVNLTPLLKRIERRKSAHDFLKTKGKLYKNLKSQFTIQNVSIDGDTASVDIQETTQIELGDPGEIKDGIVPQYIKYHRLTFELAGNSNNLKLKSHRLLNDPEDPDPERIKSAAPAPDGAIPATIDYSLNSNRPPTLKQSFQVGGRRNFPMLLASASTSRINFNSNNKVFEYPTLHLSSSKLLPRNTVSQLRTVSFNRVGTQQYAAKWWNSFNPKYRNFEQVFGLFNFGDCTNYASQILFEGGGWVMVGDVLERTSDLAWWYNFSPTIPVSAIADTQTYTWAAALNFSKFLSKYPNRATPVNRSSLLIVGDVVQVDFGLGEGLSHTMIVTSRRTADGMIYLTGHTNPHYLLPIYDIQAKYPAAKFYTWKLADSYDY